MIRLGSAFTGIGAWEKGLTDLGIDYDLKWYFEIDKYASKSYCAIHGEDDNKNKWDITQANPDELEDIDILVYSPPCQAFSIAGKQQGLKDPRGTMFYYTLPIIKAKKPRMALMENVKGLTQKKFKELFADMLNDLEQAGYKNYWKVLNAKNYGVPQNRERVFVISVRKDIDAGEITWPEPFDNGLRLKDMLEDKVEEKYYIAQERVQKLLMQINKYGNKLDEPTGIYQGNYPLGSREAKVTKWSDIMSCLTARDYKDPKTVTIPCLTPDRVNKRQNGRRFKEDGEPMFTLTSQDRHGIMQVGNIVEDGNFDNPQRGRIYSPDGLSPAIYTFGGGGLEPKILQVGMLDIKGNEQVRRVYSEDGLSPTLNSMQGGNRQPKVMQEYRIRKLTPKECWRLMGFTDEDYKKAKNAGTSNTQLYKQAGNSIVTTIPKLLFKSILGGVARGEKGYIAAPNDNRANLQLF